MYCPNCQLFQLSPQCDDNPFDKRSPISLQLLLNLLVLAPTHLYNDDDDDDSVDDDLTFIQAHLGAAISCAVMSRLRLNPIDSSLIHLWEITSYRSYWPVLTKNNYNVTP